MTLPVSEAIEGIDLTVDELAVGETLMHGQYTIENFLNAGGFGITYTARDSLDRLVVIKECFPSDYCRRSKTVVHARSRAHESKLRSLLRLFIQEARSLSKLDHPNIVGVHQVFEENNTAYMALDYVEGDDLFEVVENDPGRYDPAQIETMLRKLLTAVGFIHARGILHRDISPDNIIVDPSMEPVLIDFGAAREQATREGRPLSALLVVKDGYSPHEFYGGGGSQGPSSDLYALAATFYHLISGEMPPISQDRLSALAADEPDPCKPLLGRIEGHDDAFLAALDQAMAPLPKDRIESAEDWLAKIDKPEAKSMLRPDLAAPRDVRTLAAAALGVVAIGLIGAVMTLGGGSEEETPRAAVASAETDADAAPVEEAPAPVDVAEAEAVVADPAPEAAPVETAEAEAADTSAIAELEDVAAAMMWGEALSPSAPTSLAEVPPGTANSLEETVVAQARPVRPEAFTPPVAPPAPVSQTASRVPDNIGTTARPEPVRDPIEFALAAITDPEDADPPTVAAGTDADLDRATIEALAAIGPPERPAEADDDPRVVTVVPEVFEVDGMLTAWTVDLPAEAAFGGSGDRIVAVNGIEVGDRAAFDAALRQSVAPMPDGEVAFSVTVASAAGETQTDVWTRPIIQRTVLVNGLAFEARAEDGAWTTRITNVPERLEGRLEVGDVVIGYIPTDERIDDRIALPRIVETAAAEGLTQLALAVARDDAVYAVSVPSVVAGRGTD